MNHLSPRNQGFLYITLGFAILFIFAGSLLLPLLATILGILCISYGLELLGYPSLFIFLHRWFEEIRYRLRR